jgi:hypothetical protein
MITVKLIGLGILAIYLLGIWRFSLGYRATNFNRSLPTRLGLSLLWPVLLLANKSYRENFTKALKGR